MSRTRIVITGIGLTAPNGNNLQEFRNSLLEKKSGIKMKDVRYMGDYPAGLCEFDETKYQKKKARRRGTRAGSIAIYCANEALVDSKVDFDSMDKSRVGVFLGITEHGNVETEEEIYQLHQNNLNVDLWSHHHNPRTVSNSPAGEVNLNLKITGPHFTIGSACAGGNMGLIHGAQQLMLGEVDFAFAGGVSESAQTFGIFAAFKAQGALAVNEDPTKASRPMDRDRNGIVISEGGCVYTLERLEDAQKRGAKIYGELVGYAYNTDATDFVLPNTERQVECMEMALKKAQIDKGSVNIVNMHATGTKAGDINEALAVKTMFDDCENTYVNFTKGHIGHAMGAAGALELAGNLPSFDDHMVHPGMNLENMDPECAMRNLVGDKPVELEKVDTILNNSFGMLGINSSVIIKKY
ncbi:MAG: beta-ketoacyl synthase [Halobacteriovoraceae bacterium]|nr:beta-ketoacyl synthase [Halobacteriovoraceae bacterium]|tara:strand:- start:86972 stop:88201 length:1230 start_codon:yes stop_codon:yes gene_type:complete